MELIQRNNNQTAAQNLPANDVLIDTGVMSDCVSVIVMWNREANGRYQNMRGYHGGGGLGMVNFAL